jgi:hypothetical protein
LGHGILQHVYRAFLSVEKSALKMTNTLKNSLIIAKVIRIISVNVIVIAVTFLRKNGGLTFLPAVVHKLA